MNKHVILLSAAAVLLLSCSRDADQVIRQGETITFTAGWAGSEDTRTILQSDGTSVWWEPGAQINVFFSDKASGKFTSTNSQAQAIVDFQGSLPIVVGSVETENPPHSYWAVYPYDAANTCDGESVTLTIPSTQTAVEGTFANKMFPSIATSTNFYLAFYNVCGGVRFTVANEGIASVTFKANNGESLAGKVKVGFEGVPVLKNIVEGVSEVIVNAPTGGFVPGQYYFAALLPQTLSKGVSLTFRKEDGKVASTSIDNSITINRSRFGRMDEKDNGLEFVDDGSGTDPSNIIEFADPAAKYACVAKYDTNGDGEVSIEEAEAATSFSGLFDNWKGVTSFDEIRYFKNVHSLSGVFDGCNKLVSITVPENITDLGTYAFNGCSLLASANLPSGITSIGNNTFQNCSSLESIDIPSSVSAIGQYAFSGCYSLKNIEIPSGVASIANYCFQNCRSLASVGIPSSVTSIGEHAFHYCGSLSSIDIPSSVASIGQYAFSYCSSLESVDIPSGITSIPQYCFQYCSSLASVTIHEGVNSIGGYAFSGVKMWKLELPSSVTSLGSSCFGSIICVLLPSPSPVMSIGSNSFDGVSAIFVPGNLIEMYKVMTNWSNYGPKLRSINTYKERDEFVVATSGAVDMSTSVKWAAYNVGATAPQEYGDYYAWGETEPKSNYLWTTYKWCNGSETTLTKYNTSSSYGTVDIITQLELEDDAARANWGGSWRMPTEEEWEELVTRCMWVGESYGSIRGQMVYCFETGNTIFLPAAGRWMGSNDNNAGSRGFYWSSSLDTDNPVNAWGIEFEFSSGEVSRYNSSRYFGKSVRPVTE